MVEILTVCQCLVPCPLKRFPLRPRRKPMPAGIKSRSRTPRRCSNRLRSLHQDQLQDRRYHLDTRRDQRRDGRTSPRCDGNHIFRASIHILRACQEPDPSGRTIPRDQDDGRLHQHRDPQAPRRLHQRRSSLPSPRRIHREPSIPQRRDKRTRVLPPRRHSYNHTIPLPEPPASRSLPQPRNIRSQTLA